MALSFRRNPDIWYLGLCVGGVGGVGGVQIQSVLGGSKFSSYLGFACVSYNCNKLREKLQA